jgi:hypothetical protein
MLSRALPIRAAFVLGAIACGMGSAVMGEASIGGQDFSKIERGRYLTIAADCEACHMDPLQGSAFAGGRSIETPFGNVVAPNITPDRETGIGSWSAAAIAVRTAAGAHGHVGADGAQQVVGLALPPAALALP